MATKHSVQTISVIVPENPFVGSGHKDVKHCLAALDVEKLMEWWPGTPHSPHRNPAKVRAIQRSLDWKRVAQIAAYLLQREIIDAPERLDEFFRNVYEPKASDPGREWPPKVSRVVGFQRSEYPTFSNVLLHVNGAKVNPIASPKGQDGAAKLVFDEGDGDLNFAVIDGQHRINGAYFAVRLLKQEMPSAKWKIPSDVFIDLDAPTDLPRCQAQIFVDVNSNQKKVDRSLVADLFPTARGSRGPLDNKERAQDLGRKLMLETGPLVGMIQIPGIKYGLKGVVTLATLNRAIEGAIPAMDACDITNLEAQTCFIVQVLDSWLEAAGRAEAIGTSKLSPQNVIYQGRILVSIIDLVPAILARLRDRNIPLVSDKARKKIAAWLRQAIERAGLLKHEQFVSRDEFKELGFHGSVGIGRFRDRLWASGFSASS